jgi:hypothetical protein
MPSLTTSYSSSIGNHFLFLLCTKERVKETYQKKTGVRKEIKKMSMLQCVRYYINMPKNNLPNHKVTLQ